jgi:hypothetical protein
MPKHQLRHPGLNLQESAKSLRRWDRQLVWLSGIGFCTLIWTALALWALHSL